MDKYFEWISDMPDGVFISTILLTASAITFIIVGVLMLAKTVLGFNPFVILFGLFVLLPAYLLLKHLVSKKG